MLLLIEEIDMLVRKDARPPTWIRRLGQIGFAVAVLGTCVIIRCLDHAPTVSAQLPPVKRTVSKASKPVPTQQAAVAEDQIVAVVNGQRITRDRLAQECIRRFGEDVLEGEVNKHLILAACAERGIQVTNQDVNDEVNRMAAKFSVPVDQWLAMLEDERGITPHQYRRDVVWPTLALKRIAAKSIEVAAEELERAFESEFGAMVQVRMITTASKAKAEKLHQAASRQPERFEMLAQEHSEDVNSAAAKGLIAPVRQHVGEPIIEETAFQLKPGQISPILQVANQYVILKCDRHLPPREIGPKQREAVLAQLQDRIAEQKLRGEGKKVFDYLQSQAEIVNVYNDAERRQTMPGVAAMVNGKPITLKQLGEQCLLRHGTTVLDAEINRLLLEQALQRRGLQVQKSDLHVEIQRAAESLGYFTAEGKPDTDRWLKQITEQTGATVDLYVRDAVWPSAALKKLVNAQIDISDEDLQKSFLANYGERVEVLAIVLSDQRTAHEVFDLARKNPTERFFGELANQYSVEPVSKANFGQVPPIRMHGGQPALEREAFDLQPGQMSGIVAVGDAYILLRCLGRTKPVVDDPKLVEAEMRRDILEKKVRIAMTAEFDRLKEAAQIDNFLAKTIQSGASGRVEQVNHEAQSATTRANPTSPANRPQR